MLQAWLFLLFGFGLLYGGGESLVRGSSALALRLGLSPLIVGLTVVAFGTSSPELFVSLNATFAGSSSIVLGNVVGSNICNIALILGVAALIRPLKVKLQIIRLDTPVMLGVSFVLMLFLVNRIISRPEAFILVAGLLGYISLNIYLARREKRAGDKGYAEALPKPAGNMSVEILLILAGLGLLTFGSNLFVKAAIEIARGFGVSETVIGLTVVAVGTSLPELAAAIVAAIKNQGDLAIGNVVGSNIFNILCILGLSGLLQPIPGDELNWVDLGVMLAVALAVLPIMRSGFLLNRWEGGVLVTGYLAYIYYLIGQT